MVKEFADMKEVVGNFIEFVRNRVSVLESHHLLTTDEESELEWGVRLLLAAQVVGIVPLIDKEG